MSKHHSHEISDHPEVAWALELLKPDPTYKQSVMQEYTNEVVCVGSGFSLGCARNWFNRRPFYAGLQGHVVLMGLGYVLAQVIRKFVDEFQAERDTRLRDYIIRHPELFPEPVRVKYGDILNPWYPVR